MEAASRSPPASPLSKSQQVHTTTVADKKGWEIDPKELEITSVVKANAGSRVHKGKYRGHDVAVKELYRSSNEKKEAELKVEFLKEVEVMASGTHTHYFDLFDYLPLLVVRSSYVVFFYGAIPNPRSLVLEWMDHSLHDLMVKEKGKSYYKIIIKAIN